MSRKKAIDGVQAIIERLTNRKPCPDYLRNKANKYLDSDLFPKSHRSEKGRAEKLASEKARLLLINALTLDEVFKGETEKVVKIINKTLDGKPLDVALDAAQHDIEQRFEVYAYWKQHFPALRAMLTGQSVDLTKERLDEKLRGIVPALSPKPPMSFALSAIQVFEAIEERRRLGRLTAKEYFEQADAYMALGEYAKAEEKACEAIEIEPNHAKAWFIRVMAALQLRNRKLREMRRQRLIATEIAEPMSSQESSARWEEGEAANQASSFHEKLNGILPKALLNWPRTHWGAYDHYDQYVIVRDIFIDQMFMSVISGRWNTDSRIRHELNGLGPEWQLKNENLFAIPPRHDSSENERLPFSPDETQLLIKLIAERDKSSRYFFISGDFNRALTKDFKLLHLRWILKLDGYAEHWADWSQQALALPSHFEDYILRDDWMSRLWQVHQSINGGDASILSALDQWRRNTKRERESQSRDRLLHQYVMLFHRQFARHDYIGCHQTAKLGEAIADCASNPRQMIGHPNLEMISAPEYSPIYWRYINALSVVKASFAGETLEDARLGVLIDASSLRTIFLKTDEWQWTESIESEEGGGEDYQVEPYDINLRDEQIWRSAIQAQLACVTLSSSKERLLNTLSSLVSRTSPFKVAMPCS